MKTKKTKIISILTAICMMVSVMTGCTSTENKTESEKPTDNIGETQENIDQEPQGEVDIPEEEKYGGVLTMALSAVASNLDPIKFTGTYEDQIIRTIGDTLVAYNHDMTEMVGLLATEWSANEAGDVYNFKLRDDVYFQKGKYQDGRQMTAEDVKYSLERSAKESALNRLDMLDHVEIVNDFEVNCYLKTPNAAFLAALNNGGNIIVPKEEVEGWGDNFGAHLVGTGPFAMKEMITDQSCEVVRNDNYWGPKPYLDGVIFRFITDVNMRSNALRSGEIQIANDLKDESIKIIREDKNLKTNEIPGMQINYLYMNMIEGPTADIRVRTAIIQALDIEQMNKALYQYGEADRAYMPLPPISWGYDKELEESVPKYDPEAAKKLLAEAGYPDGFSMEYYTSDSSSAMKVATIFQQYMKQNLNIDVQIKTAQWGTFSAMGASGKAPIYGMSWTWDPDPYFYLNQMFHSNAIGSLGNGQGFNNPEVDKLLDDAVKISNQEERAKLYKQALKIIVESNAQINYSNIKIIDGLSKKVQGYDSYADRHIVICSPEVNTWLMK
ncbi:ABC transporter substrate-binding protein [Faecalimonas sp.]